ncbi:helix-turn-helix transcriptional regulator [Okibacterium endophyticum]
MTVRMSLLAILDQSPCYGYQLRAEFDRRTGSLWPLNVGQIYTTLDRLVRDGLVEKRESDEQGHVYFSTTVEGSAQVREWLAAPAAQAAGTRDELAIKLAIAATLPGANVSTLIEAQRESSREVRDRLNAAVYTHGDPGGAEELAWQVLVDSMICSADAQLRWLDRVEQRLAERAPSSTVLPVSTEVKKRGRPSKVSTDA